MMIDGDEFHSNCISKGSEASCCVSGGDHSDGCSGSLKRSLAELYKRSSDPSLLSLSEMKAAAVPRNTVLDRRL